MSTLEVTANTDRFVLYFQTEKHEINAYALAAAINGWQMPSKQLIL